jgi:excisionase family DNA binding protein
VVASEIPPALLSLQDAAAYLSVSQRKLKYLAAQGRVPGVRIDGCRRFRLIDLQEFVATLPAKSEGQR